MTRFSRSSETIEQLHWPTHSSRRSYHKAKLVFLFAKVDFHCRVFLRAVTCVKFTFANKIEANVWEQWNINGAFSRIMGFAPKLFLFSPLPPRPPFFFVVFFVFLLFFFAPSLTFAQWSDLKRLLRRLPRKIPNGRRSHYFFYGCAFIFGINELICSLSMH